MFQKWKSTLYIMLIETLDGSSEKVNQKNLKKKIEGNGRESTLNRALDGSIYPS
jgi:hypothetical protein